MKTLAVILIFITFNSFSQEPIPKDFSKETLYEELNYARLNQKAYGKSHNLKLKNRTHEALHKNIELQQKAQNWANYMANKQYHHSNMKYYESIAWNWNMPYDLIFQLIEDEGVKSLGHRKHLLGYNNKNTKVGIGLATNSKGQWFICVLTSD